MLIENGNNLAIGGSRQHILNNEIFSPVNIHCFNQTESLGTYPIAFLMRTDFDFKDEINQIIRNILEGGLIDQWNQTLTKNVDLVIPYEPITQLKMEYFYGTLTFSIGLGTFVALLAFITEHFAYTVSKMDNRPWIFMFIERFIDTQRYFFINQAERQQNPRRIHH